MAKDDIVLTPRHTSDGPSLKILEGREQTPPQARAPRSPVANEARSKLAAVKGLVETPSASAGTFAAEPHHHTTAFNEVAFEEVAKGLFDEIIARLNGATFARIGAGVVSRQEHEDHGFWKYIPNLGKLVADALQHTSISDGVVRLLERYCAEWAESAVTARGGHPPMDEADTAAVFVNNAIIEELSETVITITLGGNFIKAAAVRAENGIAKRTHTGRPMRAADIIARLNATYNEDMILDWQRRWLAAWSEAANDQVSVQEPEDVAIDANKLKGAEAKIVSYLCSAVHKIVTHAVMYDAKVHAEIERMITAADPVFAKMIDWPGMLNHFFPAEEYNLTHYLAPVVDEWLKHGREYMRTPNESVVQKARRIVREHRNESGLMPDGGLAHGEDEAAIPEPDGGGACSGAGGASPARHDEYQAVIGRTDDFQHEPYAKDSMVVKRIGRAESVDWTKLKPGTWVYIQFKDGVSFARVLAAASNGWAVQTWNAQPGRKPKASVRRTLRSADLSDYSLATPEMLAKYGLDAVT